VVASKGKSTIDVEVDTSALNALVELAEKYRATLEASNALLREQIGITKQVGSAQEKLNKTATDGRRSTREHRKREQVEDDLFPEGKRYRASGKFTSRPTWSSGRDNTGSGQFSATGAKPPLSGSLSDMDRLRWGPSRGSTGSGQFTGGWAKPPKSGSLSDLDRLPWGPGKDSTGSGQFKATFEKFAKGNDKWNESFYQMFSTGRIGQNLVRNMFSGNLLKMLGIGGIAAAAGYAVSEGAAVGAQQRRQALGIGGDIGKMKSAQVELARFGPVDPGLEAARRAKTGIGPEFSAYLQMGFSPDQLKKMDPSDLYAQMLLKAQQFAKANIGNPAMANIAEAKGLPGVLGGGMQTLNVLQGTSTEEAQNAAAAIQANAKYLSSTDEQLQALTKLTTTLNLASSEIQTHFINKLADIAPAIENMIQNSMDKIHSPPGTAVKTGWEDTTIGKFVNTLNAWGLNLGKALGTVPKDLVVPDPSGTKTPSPTGTAPNGKLKRVKGGAYVHTPVNNPPLESSIIGSGAVEEGDSNVLGGATRVSIFSPKIAKLNKDVTDTSKSLAEFNEQLLKGSRIMVGGSGQYLASKFGGTGSGSTAMPTGGAGVNIGGGGGFGTGGAAGVYHSGGIGAAGEPTEVSRTGGVVSGVTNVAKGNLAKNQQEMYSAAIAEGLSPTAARALVANSSGESLKNPADVHHDPSRRNPNQMAHGIASWDDERSARIMKQFGKMPQDMSVAEQTKAMIWEQKNFYPKTWQALSGGGSAEEMTGTLVSDFERPGNVGQATSQRLGYLKGFHPDQITSDGKGGGGGAGATGGAPEANFGIKDSDDVLDHLKSARNKGLITNDQCVSLATASVGIKLGSGQKGAWTSSWRKGESVAEGNLVKGTPIATFAGLHGEQNQNIYAGGTGGRAGVGLDHAAVFESYIRNKQGKITGMNVADQWAKSGGIRNQHPYMFGGGPGELDAANYSAIKTAGGEYLGGANNPLTQRDAARQSSTRSASRSGPHPHIGDMAQYNQDKGIKLHINNPAGADVIAQNAMLGSAQGNYG
jgi:Phage tail lysozyme